MFDPADFAGSIAPLNPGSPSHYMPAAGALIAVDGMGAGTADATCPSRKE